MLLLETYKQCKADFCKGSKKKYQIWREIASVMQGSGYQVTGEGCAMKMRSLRQTYKKIKGKKRMRRRGTDQHWPYFEMMDNILACDPSAKPSDAGEACLSGSTAAASPVADSSGSVSLRRSSQVWLVDSTLLMLEAYKKHKADFCKGSRKRKYQIWREIASVMQQSGCQVTGEECDKKMRSLKQTYRKIKDNNKLSERGSDQQWIYFNFMDDIMASDPSVKTPDTKEIDLTGTQQPETAVPAGQHGAPPCASSISSRVQSPALSEPALSPQPSLSSAVPSPESTPLRRHKRQRSHDSEEEPQFSAIRSGAEKRNNTFNNIMARMKDTQTEGKEVVGLMQQWVVQQEQQFNKQMELLRHQMDLFRQQQKQQFKHQMELFKQLQRQMHTFKQSFEQDTDHLEESKRKSVVQDPLAINIEGVKYVRVFTLREELKLAQYIKKVSTPGLRPNMEDLCKLVFNYAVKFKITRPNLWNQHFSADTEWLKGFLRRHPTIYWEPSTKENSSPISVHNLSEGQSSEEDCANLVSKKQKHTHDHIPESVVVSPTRETWRSDHSYAANCNQLLHTNESPPK